MPTTTTANNSNGNIYNFNNINNECNVCFTDCCLASHQTTSSSKSTSIIIVIKQHHRHRHHHHHRHCHHCYRQRHSNLHYDDHHIWWHHHHHHRHHDQYYHYSSLTGWLVSTCGINFTVRLPVCPHPSLWFMVKRMCSPNNETNRMARKKCQTFARKNAKAPPNIYSMVCSIQPTNQPFIHPSILISSY